MPYNINSFRLVVVAAAIFIAAGCKSEQRTYSSPEAAVTALGRALETQDRDELKRIFGPGAEELKTGDPEQDREDATVFARKLKTQSKVRMDTPDQATVLVGADEWPFAVPLVMNGSKWKFDTDAGLEELTNRRIGRNELRTIAACRTVIDAQAEFFDRDPDGLGTKHYAQRLMSTEGKKDGLYWESPGGVDPSPVGPALALASTRRDAKGDRIPFNGYLFKGLRRQGAGAPGGAMDYEQNGQLTRGWAIIAYPAIYGETGIMSFLCSHNGIVYERDLGDATATTVEGMNTFDPGTDWKNVRGENAK